MLNNKESNDDLLASWKEIADFFKVDVKTCQRWEKTFDLPVHRYDGMTKSRVYAQKEALRLWQERHLKGNSTSNHSPLRANRKIKAYVFVLIPFLTLASYFILSSFLKKNPVPADYHIMGSKLVIIDDRGKDLWAFDTKLTKLASEKHYREIISTTERERKNPFPYVLIQDINNDGDSEVVFSTQTADDYGEGKLYCFDHRGKISWEYQAGSAQKFGATTYSQDYRIMGLAAVDVNGDHRPEIVINVAHMQEFPSQICVLDAAGKLLGKYWNSGRITDMEFKDINNDNLLEIIAVGTNNEYGKACLIAFNPNNINGCSPQLLSEFKCGGCPAGTEEFYILFPRTDVDKIESSPQEAMERISIQNNNVFRVMPVSSKIQFFLNFQFDLIEVKESYDFIVLHDKLVQEGRIQSVLNDEYFDKLKRGVLYWNGSAWTSQLARAND